MSAIRAVRRSAGDRQCRRAGWTCTARSVGDGVLTPDPVRHKDPKQFECIPKRSRARWRRQQKSLGEQGKFAARAKGRRPIYELFTSSFFGSRWPGVPPASMRGAAAANGPGAPAARIAFLRRAPFMHRCSAARGNSWRPVDSRQADSAAPCMRKGCVAQSARTTRAPQAARGALLGVVHPAGDSGKGLHGAACMSGSSTVSSGMRNGAQAEGMT